MVLRLFALVALLAVALGCSDPDGSYKAPTLDWKVKESRVVAHGLVLSSDPDPRFPGFPVYSVQLELRCLYKGVSRHQVITIEEVGAVPGHCHSTELNVGEKYLVYLEERDSGRYRQKFTQDPGDSDYLDEIVGLCETAVSYPTGYNRTYNKELCPEKEPMDECVPVPTSPAGKTEAATSVDQQPATPVDQQPASPGETSAAYKPVVVQQDDNNNNGSESLTLHLSLSVCLVMSLFWHNYVL